MSPGGYNVGAGNVGKRNALNLVFSGDDGRTVLTRRRYRWPLSIGRVFTEPGPSKVGSVTIQNAAGTVIPGDVVRQCIEVLDGGSAAVRGQGATLVSGIPGGEVAVEDTCVRVDATSRLLLDASPRILTAHARYLQRADVCVASGGRVVLVDAVVLHPELLEGKGFGSYESNVAIRSPDGVLMALDAQLLEALPRVRRAPTAFGTVYVVGNGLDATALAPDLEALSVLTGDRRVYVGVSTLPNDAGWVVRVSASDGGTLRATINAVTTTVEAACLRSDLAAVAG